MPTNASLDTNVTKIMKGLTGSSTAGSLISLSNSAILDLDIKSPSRIRPA
jgi:hypothetical protein